MDLRRYTMIWALLWAGCVQAAEPQTFPVFLKQGFSTVLEFENAPKRIVLGDSQNFQVERMEKSLVVRALAPFATGNLFVFFDSGEPRVFVLTASEDAEPTLYRKFEEVKPLPPPPQKSLWVRHNNNTNNNERGLVLRSTTFDVKKDYLTLDALITADSSRPLRPEWKKARLKFKSQLMTPTKLWAERKEVQTDSSIRARFIFAKPNLPRDFGGAVLVIPLLGEPKALSVELRRIK
jgi:hypothetical protein